MLILATGYDGLTGALTAFDVVGRNASDEALLKFDALTIVLRRTGGS